VWVTGLTDGRPVKNARVRLVNLPGASGSTFTTDAFGVAEIPATELAGAEDATLPGGLVVVESESDWAYAHAPSIDGYEYAPLGTVFTDRGIYRPGEKVFVKGWIRKETATGTLPTEGAPVTIQLRHDDTHEDEVQTRTSAHGGFHAVLHVPSYAALGWHEVSVVGGGYEGRESLKVGEYRSAEFSADVTMGEASVTRGEPIVAHVRGEYLFGGGMARAEVEAWGNAEPAGFRPTVADGFFTDAWDYREQLRRVFQLPSMGGSDQESLLDDNKSSHLGIGRISWVTNCSKICIGRVL
jgi:uncharacterized protein YfaS (alpha-2-macroglobulin family)